MKRPLAVVGFTMLSVLFVLCKAQSGFFTLVALGVAVLSFLVCLFSRSLRKSPILSVVFGSAAAACLLLLVFEAVVFLPQDDFCAERAEITAVLLESPRESSDGKRLYFSSKLKKVNGETKNARVRLSFPAKEWKRNTPLLPNETRKLEPGDEVTFVGKLYLIAEGSEDVRLHFKSNKISLSAYPLEEVTVKRGAEKTLYTALMRERKKAINQILNVFDGRTAGLLIAVLMGDKSYVSDEIYHAFSVSGVAHIMAVSGLHLSIWISFALDFLKKRSSLSKPKVLFLMLFTVLIMLFASFSGSVKRAGFMMLLYLSSYLFSAEPDSLNSLGFSCVCVLFYNPYSAVNASFLLSFLATLSIILFALPLSDLLFQNLGRRHKLVGKASFFKAILTCVLLSFFANILTLPLQIEYFGGFSTVGIVTNLFLLPTTAPLLLSGGLYVMFYFVPLFSGLFRLLATVLSEYCIFVAETLSSFRFAFVSVEKKFVPFFAVISVVVFLLTFFLLKREKSLARKKEAW